MGSWADSPITEPPRAEPHNPATSDHAARRHSRALALGRALGRRLLPLALPTPGLWGLIALSLGPWLWIPALMRDATSHVMPLMAVAAALAVITRRYPAALLNAASLTLCLTILVGPRAPALGPDREQQPEAIRVVQINALTSNPQHDEVLRLISDPQIDILSLIECPIKLSRSIRADEVLTGLNRVVGATNPPYTQWILLFSRWPMDPWESSSASTPGLVAAVIHAPTGPLGVVSLHASAPWEPPRWRTGNTTIRGAARIASEMQRAGLPVMVVGDLNATPLSARTSWLREVGLKRSKPLFTPAGTFPSTLPWPLQIASDDAVVSEEIRVQSWKPFRVPGSDHRGVSMEMVVLGQKPSE